MDSRLYDYTPFAVEREGAAAIVGEYRPNSTPADQEDLSLHAVVDGSFSKAHGDVAQGASKREVPTTSGMSSTTPSLTGISIGARTMNPNHRVSVRIQKNDLTGYPHRRIMAAHAFEVLGFLGEAAQSLQRVVVSAAASSARAQTPAQSSTGQGSAKLNPDTNETPQTQMSAATGKQPVQQVTTTEPDHAGLFACLKSWLDHAEEALSQGQVDIGFDTLHALLVATETDTSFFGIDRPLTQENAEALRRLGYLCKQAFDGLHSRQALPPDLLSDISDVLVRLNHFLLLRYNSRVLSQAVEVSEAYLTQLLGSSGNAVVDWTWSSNRIPAHQALGASQQSQHPEHMSPVFIALEDAARAAITLDGDPLSLSNVSGATVFSPHPQTQAQAQASAHTHVYLQARNAHLIAGTGGRMVGGKQIETEGEGEGEGEDEGGDVGSGEKRGRVNSSSSGAMIALPYQHTHTQVGVGAGKSVPQHVAMQLQHQQQQQLVSMGHQQKVGPVPHPHHGHLHPHAHYMIPMQGGRLTDDDPDRDQGDTESDGDDDAGGGVGVGADEAGDAIGLPIDIGMLSPRSKARARMYMEMGYHPDDASSSGPKGRGKGRGRTRLNRRGYEHVSAPNGIVAVRGRGRPPMNSVATSVSTAEEELEDEEEYEYEYRRVKYQRKHSNAHANVTNGSKRGLGRGSRGNNKQKMVPAEARRPQTCRKCGQMRRGHVCPFSAK